MNNEETFKSDNTCWRHGYICRLKQVFPYTYLIEFISTRLSDSMQKTMALISN